MATKKRSQKPRSGRPPQPLPKLQTTPETLAKELLKQRPLKDVEQEQRGSLASFVYNSLCFAPLLRHTGESRYPEGLVCCCGRSGDSRIACRRAAR